MLSPFFEKLKMSNEEGSVNIVCLGDSITQGCFGSEAYVLKHFDLRGSYVEQFREMLHNLFPHKIFNVINSGIGGKTATHAVARFERDVLAYHPDLVIIAFGVNDAGDPDSYVRSLGTMFDELNARGIPCIYMTEHMMNTKVADDTQECLKNYAAHTAEIQNNGTMDALFDAGIATANERRIPVCNIYAKWKRLHALGMDTNSVLDNRINHPIPEMHTLYAASLISTIFFEGHE